MRLEENQGRQGPSAVNGRKQSTEKSSQQKLDKCDGQRKVAAKRGVGTCGLRSQVSQRERMGQRSWSLCGKFARIHTHDSPQKTTEKCQKLLPSCAWS